VIEIDKQLKQEKLATNAKQIQVIELEKNIVSLSENPKNIVVVEDLIKQKNNQIKVLKKKLNVPNIQHVQATKLQAKFGDKEKLYQKLVHKIRLRNAYRLRMKP
jgi:hypothetical protein